MRATKLTPWNIRSGQVEDGLLILFAKKGNDSISRGSLRESALSMELAYKSIS